MLILEIVIKKVTLTLLKKVFKPAPNWSNPQTKKDRQYMTDEEVEDLINAWGIPKSAFDKELAEYFLSFVPGVTYQQFVRYVQMAMRKNCNEPSDFYCIG
ncbi:hypothetical protein GCM10017706_26320 [Lactococcus lactis subsp. hordniae]